MTKELLDRLRTGYNCRESGSRCRILEAASGCDCAAAADEIERLHGEVTAAYNRGFALGSGDEGAYQREITRLRAALGDVLKETYADTALTRKLHGIANEALGNVHEPLPVGVKCIHCNGKGVTDQIYDEQRGGWSAPDVPCQTCGGNGRIRTVEQYLKTLPANWHVDSSLETWFPITAEELDRLRSVASHEPACVVPPEKRYCTCFFMGKDDVRPDHSPDCMLNDGNKLNASRTGE